MARRYFRSRESVNDGVDLYEMGSSTPVARAHSVRPSRQYPHCDARVVHAPGECEYCDRSGLQEIREAWGINFTGHNDPEKLRCPAEVVRGIDTINRWGGNVAAPPELSISTYMEEVKKRRRSLAGVLKSFSPDD